MRWRPCWRYTWGPPSQGPWLDVSTSNGGPGLTYAQYARSGFFQLIAVVSIVVAVVVTLRPLFEEPVRRHRLLALCCATLALTLAVVALSIVRLQTYRAVYGLTMLRFATTVFAAWLGVVLLVLVGTLVWGPLRREFVATVVVSAFVTLMIVNAVNPEAVVARENIGRIGRVTTASDGFDGIYLQESLGDDATPAIVARLGRLPAGERTRLLAVLCVRRRVDDGWSWNAGRAKASAARRRACT